MTGAPVEVGRWRVWLAAGGAADDAAVWLALVARAGEGAPVHGSKHARTYSVATPRGEVFVKVFHAYRWRTVLKDLLRASKARHALRIGRRLGAAGFRVPEVVAVGEERRTGVVRRSWVATRIFDGAPVASRLAILARGLAGATARTEATGVLEQKRRLLDAVGREVGRLHLAGFVAGDLVPPNVWSTGPPGPSGIGLLDHDRTAYCRLGVPWWRARRNLVQLNRVVLAGVTTTDRLRVYRAYAVTRRWRRARARRRLHWIVAKTIARRRSFDRAPVPHGAVVSFRELMRAGGPLAPALRDERAGDDPGPDASA